jgi:hypothetical protein
MSAHLLNEQPDPVHATGDVWLEVILDTRDDELVDLYARRREQGLERYNTPLQRDNGRDHLADAIQELADAVVYLQAANKPWARKLVEQSLRTLLDEVRLRDGRLP